jgi:multidrug efflux pump subunit AcrA (membrane-fusion protein)
MTFTSRTIAPVLLLLLTAGCARPHNDDEERTVPPLVSVKTVPVRLGNMPRGLEVTGTTEALRKVRVFSPIAGTLLAMKVQEGEAVRAGDVLAVVQPREARAALAGAEALKRGARTDAERAEADRAIELARSRQSLVEVRASSDGIIASRSAVEGELVAENTELATLLDPGTVVFLADVPVARIGEVRSGGAARVRLPAMASVVLDAVVESESPRTEPASQSVRVRLRFTGVPASLRGLLKAEMGGSAWLTTGTTSGVLLVPPAAILRDDEAGVSRIVLAGADSMAHIVTVTIGGRTDSSVEVAAAGLDAGMPVIVEGQYALSDSTRIAVTP